jgi:hypothetical protein
MTNQNSREMELVYGKRPVAPLPNFEFYGCTLVPVGTLLYVQERAPVPVLAGELPGGKTFRGVTFPEMLAAIPQSAPQPSISAPNLNPDTPSHSLPDITAPQSTSQPAAAQAPQGAPAAGIPQTVLAEMKSAERLNDIYRDSSPEKPDAMATCDQRDVLMQKLATEGWCWNPHSTTFAEAWPRCAP